MPNCFTLTLKGQDKAALLTDVDEAICKHLGVEVHPTKYVYSWFDSIGFALAHGKDWEWIKERYKDYPEDLAIADFLEANYTVNAWAER